MDEESIDVLIDLLKIYKRYGGRKMTEVGDLLKQKDFFAELADILEYLPELNRNITNKHHRNQNSQPLKVELNKSLSKPKKGTGTRNRSISKELKRMKEKSPKKYKVLSEIYSRLLSGDLLPTVADIRNFAIENHIAEAVGKDRRTATRHLMIFLIDSKNSRGDTDHLLREMVKFTSNKDNSTLQRWADMIMRDKWKEDGYDSKGGD